MNVLVIGGGGREHALVWGLKRSPKVKKIYCAPGNAGIAALAECVVLDGNDHAKVERFVQDKEIDLTIIGPEAPLVAGLADFLRAAEHNVFGPGQIAAQLEGSKIFSKQFMEKHGIPTAKFKPFFSRDEAIKFVTSSAWPKNFLVVKADGLAAGKGVVVAKDRDEVLKAIDDMMLEKVFGKAGEHIVLEEVLEGNELSFMAFVGQNTWFALPFTQDHKRAYDDDKGPNTGGMGAFVLPPNEVLVNEITHKVGEGFLKGLEELGIDYRGVIYVGLMMTVQGPQVLEFNVRFGDPETEVIIPMIEDDLFSVLLQRAKLEVEWKPLKIRNGAAITVVMASDGYPGDSKKGKVITGLEEAAKIEGINIFHAGTAKDSEGHIVTAGGRVLAVTAVGKNLSEAREIAYKAVQMIKFDGAHYRKDIGARALKPMVTA